MKAEIISVGTELLLGSTVNTDAADVAVLLSEYGINVYWQTVVGDNPGRVAEAVRRARSRADLIITTGGLGPTCDDLTKSALAEGFGMELQLDRKLADKRIYPAVNVIASGTRREDLLLQRDVMNRTWVLRKYLSDMTTVEAMEFLEKQLNMTSSNEEFLATMNQ